MARTLKTFRQPHFAEAGHDGFLVLTPHRAAAAGIGVATKTLESIAREIVTEAGYIVASDLTALMTLRAAVKAVMPGEKPSAYMSRIAKTLDTVLREGLDTKMLRDSSSIHVSNLGKVAEEYVARLRSQNMIARAETLLFASTLKLEKRKIAVYGYFRGRVQEAKFIDAIADEGSVYFLPVGEADWFKANHKVVEELVSKGWSVDNSGTLASTVGSVAAATFSNSTNEINGSECKAFRFSNRDKEIRATLSQVKRLVLDGVAPSDISVLCRKTDDYGPETARIADEYGMRIDMSFSMPLHETMFGGFMQLVTEVIKAPGYENVLRILMHPFGSRIQTRQLREAFRTHPCTREEWEGIGVEVSFLFAPDRLSRGEWKSFIENLFETFKTRRSAGVQAREIVAFNEFNDCLREFCFESREELTKAQFAAEIGEILWSCSVPFSPAKGGISFHDPDTIIGGRFKHLFVMGASEGDLPASISDSPVVDFLERRKLAEQGIFFESASDISRWAALSFYFTLLTTSESLTISYAQTVDKEEKMESEVIERLELKARDFPSNEELISSLRELRRARIRTEEDSDDEVLAHSRCSYYVEQHRESSDPQGEFDGNIGVPFDNPEYLWSASQLTEIGQCGFKWFAKRLLRLAPIEEMDVELTPLTLGSLYHRALEFAAEGAIGVQDAKAVMLDALEAAFERAEQDQKVKLPVLRNWNIQRKEYISKLRRAIKSEAFIREGATIVATEKDFRSEWKGFKVRGSIDRIDRTDEGFIVVDYKSGSTKPLGAKDEKGKPVLDVQIPLYLEAGIPSLDLDSDLAGVEGVYFSISSADSLKEVRLDDQGKLDAFAARVQEMISTGNFSVSPPTGKKVCDYCDMSSVCRRGNRIKRKEAFRNTNESI